MKETYSTCIVCSNCHLGFSWNVPWGIRVEDFAERTECLVCGCKLRVSI